MQRLIVALCLTALPLLSAAAAPACTISPIKGLTDPTGARVTMDVTTPGRPCGTKLWVQNGVIPFEALRATRQPLHGHLTVSDPTQFSYSPDADYTGTDLFEIIARGNTRSGGQVTGTMRVDVTVTRDR
jgi:hypothetical protein